MNITNILAIAALAASSASLATAQSPAPKPLPCPIRQVDRAAVLNNIVRELEAAGLPPHEILELMKVIAPKVVNAPAGRHVQKPKRGAKVIPAARIQPAPAPKDLPKASDKEVRMKLYINGKEINPDAISGTVVSRGDLKIRAVDPQTLKLPTPPATKPECKAPKPAPKPAACPIIKINGREMPLPAEGGKVIINTDGGVTVTPATKPECKAPKPAPKPAACPLPPAPEPAGSGTIAKPVIGGADTPIASPKPAATDKPAARPVIKINGQPVELPEGGGKVIINADGRIISRG